MTCKFTKPTDSKVASQIGATLEALQAILEGRKSAGPESYSAGLLNGSPDKALKKLVEEAAEVALAVKDLEACSDGAAAAANRVACEDSAAAAANRVACEDHLRYEAGDVLYHLMVILSRYNISLDELAAELNTRMTDEERPVGGVQLLAEHVNRGR